MLNHDGAYFAVVLCLPLVVRLLLVPRIGRPVRAWSASLGEQLWTHLREREEPDEQVLQRWALARLDELERHLARVRQLVVSDDDMSATRQLGNRIALERLLVDAAAAFDAAPDRVDDPPRPAWRPSSPVRYLAGPACVAASAVEVLEFGPGQRGR